MPNGSKPPRTQGNPLLTRVARVEARVDVLEAHRKVDEARLHEHDLDIAQLADIVLRASRRARARLASRRKASGRRSRR